MNPWLTTAEVITLMQAGKCSPMPLVFLEAPARTHWASKVEFLRREWLDCVYIDRADLTLLGVVHAVDEAVMHTTISIAQRCCPRRPIKRRFVICRASLSTSTGETLHVCGT